MVFLVYGSPTFFYQTINIKNDRTVVTQHLITNKTLYRALTRWGYPNTHITAHDT